MTRLIFKWAVSLGIAVGLILLFADQGLDVVPSRTAILETAAWWACPLYIVLFAVFHILRAWRWIYLLRPFAKVSAGTMMEAAFVGFLAIQMMPLRTGEVTRPYLLDRFAGISKSAVFGTIAIERVVDGLIISLWLSAALFSVPSSASSYVWELRLIPMAIFLSALFVLVAFYKKPQTVKLFIEKGAGLVSPRIALFFSGVLERFHKGLAALPNQRSFGAFVGVSAVYWGINALGFHLLARGCGLDLSFVGAVAGMGCLAVGILLPAGPGYFGNFQVSVLIALQMYVPLSPAGSEAAVFIFLLYLFQTGLTIAFGAAAAWKLYGSPTKSLKI
jgi:hypothetical protein